jgi:hypothetical protein
MFVLTLILGVHDFTIAMKLCALAAFLGSGKEVIMTEFWHDLIPNGWIVT